MHKIGIAKLPTDTRTEIVRSFSYKLNMDRIVVAGKTFESRDFFCSQKAECNIEDAEDISDRLYHFCKREVMKSVNEYMHEYREAQQIRKAAS